MSSLCSVRAFCPCPCPHRIVLYVEIWRHPRLPVKLPAGVIAHPNVFHLCLVVVLHLMDISCSFPSVPDCLVKSW